jgi:hypothetical protein
VGNLFVGRASRHQAEDLQFSFAKLFVQFWHRGYYTSLLEGYLYGRRRLNYLI